MPRGLFTQGLVVLGDDKLTASTVETALNTFGVKKHTPAEAQKDWIQGYETWIVSYRPEQNGYVVVELLEARWPDHMGSPQEDAMLFGAWSMGFFGPFTFPGNLQRATFYTAAFGRKALAEAASGHTRFVRIRSSYVLGGDDTAPIVPPGYDPRQELDFVTSVAKAIAAQPGAICCFNPGGEALRTANEFDEIAKALSEPIALTVESHTASRMMRIDDAPPWFIVDVVGMEQFDGRDQEAIALKGTHNHGEVAAFLKGICCYTLDKGDVIKDGHTADGPGGKWRAFQMERGLIEPPRQVLRWLPDDGPRPPAQLMPQSKVPAKPGFFARMKSIFHG